MGEEVIGWPEDREWSEDKVQTGPPALLRKLGAVLASVALHRGSPCPGDERAGGDGNNEDENYVYAILL